MMSFRSYVGCLSLVAFAFACGSVAGCGKKETSTDKGEKSEKSEKKDDDGKKKKKDEGEYATGDLLKHLPKACKKGRFYVNVGLFLKNEAVEKSAEALEEKFTSGKKSSKSAAKAFKSLKKSGIDPAHDVKEFALCMEGEKDPVIAIGGEFHGKDPIKAISKAAEDAGEKDLEVKESDGVPYVKDGKSFIGEVSPGVLVITQDKADFAELKEAKSAAKEWNVDTGRIFSFTFHEKKSGAFDGTITESGDDLVFKVTADFAGETGEKIEEDPKQFKKGVEAQLAKIEKKLAKGPFKKIADDIGASKIKVDGSKVTLTCTMPAVDLGNAVKTAASSSEEDLENAVDL